MSDDPQSNQHLQERAQAAETAMHNVQTLIDQEAQASGKKKAAKDNKESKDRMRKILTSTYQFITIVEGASEMNPFAKGSVVLFKSLLRLEIDRRDNAEQVVAVFHSMSSMIFVLKFLRANAFEDQYDLKEQFEYSMRDIQDIMRNFGDFADTYYNKCKNGIVRLLRSGDFKEKLAGFDTMFRQHRETLHFLLGVRASAQIQKIDQAVQRIISTLGQPTTPKEVQATQIMQRSGGELGTIGNEAALNQIAKLLNEKITHDIHETLRIDLDELMDRNLAQFTMKLQGAEMEVKEAIERSRDAILHKLDDGPHDFISEPHIKELWKTNAWKLSVKCRPFADAICNYFDDQFRKQSAEHGGVNPPDHWTLSVLSKVIYHPAIGDAIDEDGSGFISVHEVNHFLKRIPEGWSVPQWFAYWAIGWQYTNITYTSQIAELAQSIQRTIEATKKRRKDQHVDEFISEYLDTIFLVGKLVEWIQFGDDTGTSDLSPEASAQIETICDGVIHEQDVKIVQQLSQANYYITDDSQLTTITGQPGFRIEQWMMCLLCHLLRKHYEWMDGPSTGKGKRATRGELSDQEWYDMDIRGWRSQKIDVELQIETFAGGVYEGWYNAYNAGGRVKKILEGDDDNDDDEDEGADNEADSEATPIDMLNRKFDGLESRLTNIENMLQQLLASKGVTPAAKGANANAPASRGLPGAAVPRAAPPQNPEPQGEDEDEDGGYGEQVQGGDEGEGGGDGDDDNDGNGYGAGDGDGDGGDDDGDGDGYEPQGGYGGGGYGGYDDE